MSDPKATGADAVPMPGRSAVVAAALAWAVPGLGHLYLGWRRRAGIYFVVLAVMVTTGLLCEGGLSHPAAHGLGRLGALADLGLGAAYFVLELLHVGGGRAASATHEAGNAFHWSAGVMNMLLVLDAWDIATGRKRQDPK